MSELPPKDFIVLGNAAPDELRDLRKSVCYAGYSEEKGLIRIYPVPPEIRMGRWHRVEAPLVRNPEDVRKESWKIKGSKQDYDKMDKIIKVGEEINRKSQRRLLDRLQAQYGVDCIESLNERRLSLGFIKPKTFHAYFEKRENVDPSKQATLFGGEPFWTIHNYSYQPRLRYTCQSCKLTRGYHDQQILEWGIYEWMRDHPDRIEDVWKNMHFGEPDYDTYLLVGNQARRLNSFMVISVFRFKWKDTPEQTRLFD